MTTAPAYSVVVPTVGRATLVTLIAALGSQPDPMPEEIIVVDDRPSSEAAPLSLDVPEGVAEPRVVRSWGRGPAAARNLGWHLTRTPWVAFLDDDVVIAPDWTRRLAADLAGLAGEVGGSQGRLHVPLPGDRRPTDWERSTAGLESASWATADMAYRRRVLVAVGGFDERFPRAYREDADLALRVRRAEWRTVVGGRVTTHPVRPSPAGVSVTMQRGNADDALMRRLHGRHWRSLAETGRGRLAWHVGTTGAVLAAAVAAPLAPRSRSAAAVLRLSAAGAAGALIDFAGRRILAGPRTPHEMATMAWTSVVIPLAAVWHRSRGWWRHRRTGPWPTSPKAVLFDRDGTLVHDVPYNHDPAAVRSMPGARSALDRLRGHGLRLGVVTNQSGVGRGLLTRAELGRVNAQVERQLGPFDHWQVCPHGPEDECTCRKPRPGMVLGAARALGVRPEECVVIGDIGSDVAAAHRAGARAVLVPTPVTRPEEVAEAPFVASSLAEAVDLVLGWSRE